MAAKEQERSLMTEHSAKKLYSTILADPPWDFDQRGNYGAIHHYDLMSLDRIKAMPVADLAAPNAHLYLWITNGALPYGFEIMKAWGFQYKSLFTWVKPKLGLGNYIRNSTEQVLFGTRGKAPVLFKAQPSWGFFPMQDHSHKPEEFHKIIERMSPGPYLELFARRRQPGWDVWGNEIDSDITIPGYPAPARREEK
jgi:N6-adenosine-specific RNA methylase IME4